MDTSYILFTMMKHLQTSYWKHCMDFYAFNYIKILKHYIFYIFYKCMNEYLCNFDLNFYNLLKYSVYHFGGGLVGTLLSQVTTKIFLLRIGINRCWSQMTIKMNTFFIQNQVMFTNSPKKSRDLHWIIVKIIYIR